MKKNTTTHILFDEASKQQERFEKLYGPGDYTATIAKNIKHTLWLISSFIILFVVLLMVQMDRANIANHGVALDRNGNIISIERPDKGDGTIVLDTMIISDSGDMLTDQGIKLMISPLQTEEEQKSTENNVTMENKEDYAQHEIRKAVYQLNEDTTIRNVPLPQKLTDGTRVYWVPKNTYSGWFVLLVIVIGCFAIYHNRDAGLIKTEKAAKESVLRELPEFVNKLVLLLNAGLILSSAFYKIVSDYERIRGGETIISMDSWHISYRNVAKPTDPYSMKLESLP